MPRAKEQNHNFHEAIGLALLGLGTLIFLALISYTPRDVPSWFPLHSFATPNRHTLNFIGPFGAIVACTCYSFFGAAAYLFPAMLLGCGGLKLLTPSLYLTRRSAWAVAFLFSAAALAHLLPFKMVDAVRLNISGAGEGGWIGKWLGQYLFGAVFGPVGAGIVLGVIYLSSLLSMVGIPPMQLVRKVVALPSLLNEKLAGWRAASARAAAQRRLDEPARQERRAPPASFEPSEPAALKERRRNERALPKKLPLSEPDFDDTRAPVEEEAPRPAPKIIDGTAPPPNKERQEKAAKKASEPLQAMATVSCENYELPSFDLLDPIDISSREAADPGELLRIQDVIIETLAQFSIVVSRGDITRGPTITRYEVYPAKGVRVDRIVSLERDIARATSAERINILAPIPGKDTVGIEIANSKKQKVTLRELIESDDFLHSKARIPIALGKDVYGKTVIADLAAMPHGLVAGTTGSGKSVCINAIIASILYRFTPEDLRLIMIDPKVVEMQMYNALPHLVVPVVTDPKKVLLALRWAVDEMERRYAIFAKTNVRNIGGFNSRILPKSQKQLDEEEALKQSESDNLDGIADAAPADLALLPNSEADPEEIDFSDMSDDEVFKVAPKPKISVPRDSEELIIPDRMPYIVIIVDELADLMQTAPADVESAIARITQKARAAGLHMIIATQTPRADVITGVIKANVPCRIAFQVSSPLDSRVILDENGAERLLGQGDMLYRPPGTSRMIRAQGVLVTDEEVQRVVDHASAQSVPAFESSIHQRLQSNAVEEEEVSAEDEELVEKCIEVMRQEKKASTSLFQRRLRLGYTRAARILDILEARGYVAAGEGAKPREILKDLDA
ncbi:MAG: spoIIIE [Chthoniobacteraceae bacterium]|nr:spoIIIE [Chthoniobacteraceae bacterium]